MREIDISNLETSPGHVNLACSWMLLSYKKSYKNMVADGVYG